MPGESERLLTIGQSGLEWLASDAEELERFMALTGYSPDGLRAAVGTRPLAAAIIDYLGRNEPQLLAMSANTGTPTSAVMHMFYAINRHDA